MEANKLREKNLLEANIKLQSKVKDLENDLYYKDKALKKGISMLEKVILVLKDKEEIEEYIEEIKEDTKDDSMLIELL